MAPRLGFVWVPTDDRKLAIRGSAGLFFDQNHFNYNDVYVNQTLLANRRVNFNCNSTTDNPFYNARRTGHLARALSRVSGRALSAFPERRQPGLIPELAVALAPDFRVPFTRQATIGFTTASRRIWAQADYVYSDGDDVLLQRNLNLDFVNGQWVTKDPRFTGINVNENLGYIRYNALQTRTEYAAQARTGLSYMPKGDIQQQRQRRRRGAATNPLDLSVDDGPTNEDRRHNLVGRLVSLPARVPARRHLSLRQRLAL